MLVLQNINEFIKLSSNLKDSAVKSTVYLNNSSCIVLSNKLKQINSQFSLVTSAHLSNDFFTNLYSLLSQSNCFDVKKNVENLLESCLDICLSATTTPDEGVKQRFLNDCRFLPVVSSILSNLAKCEDNDEQVLIKHLTVIRELLNHSTEITEHNMNLIIHSLRDFTVKHKNPEVGSLCLTILVNLCLKNEAAKYLITRAIKQTAFKEKINNIQDNLVAFKYFILIEDEIFSNDVKYFLSMSLRDIKSSISSLKVDAINHSLDVLDHIDQMEVSLDFKISDQEELAGLLHQINTDVVEKLAEDDSARKMIFFSSLFHFYNVILNLDPSLVDNFKIFSESAFLSTVGKSANALKFLTTYIRLNGELPSAEIIVEGLMDDFVNSSVEERMKIEFKRKFAFLCLLEPFQSRSLLSDVHLTNITNYFDQIISDFKSSNLSSLSDEEVFHFIYFVFALSSVKKSNFSFFGKLVEVLKLDFLPALMARGYESKNKEILEVLFKLSSVENFPIRKISSLLSKCTRKLEIFERKTRPQPQRTVDLPTKWLAGKLEEEMDQLITRIKEKIDSGEVSDVRVTDLMQLFRQKNDLANEQLMNVNAALEQNMLENGELKQKIGILNALTSKQDFSNWCLQLDKERLIGEMGKSTRLIESLKNSIDVFQKKLEKKEVAIHQAEKTLNLKIKEIKEIQNQKEQIEKKLEDCKAKLAMVQSENESRILELKSNLENIKKTKSEELTAAIAEQTKLNQKLSASEKERQNLKELVTLQESQINEKVKENQQMESALKEAEQMKNTIMSLMSSKSFKNK